MSLIKGIHHITAFASNAQRNINFYSGILGLRVVKQTVNFDDPTSYHIFYGDGIGTPGTLLTFIVKPELEYAAKGTGLINSVSFKIKKNSLGFWIERLTRYGVQFEGPFNYLNNQILRFTDIDGMTVELVSIEEESKSQYWSDSSIPDEHFINGIYGVSIWEISKDKTENFLTEALGFNKIAKLNGLQNVQRYKIGNSFIDIRETRKHIQGNNGAGGIHHIAFTVENNNDLYKIQKRIDFFELKSSHKMNRKYFESIYFRDPEGILLEAATFHPGLLEDENEHDLGESLQLPEEFEYARALLEETLPEIYLPHQRSNKYE